MLADTLLMANNSQHSCMLAVASVCTRCCMLFRVVHVGSCSAKLKPVKLSSQQLSTVLLSFDGTLCTSLPTLLGPPTRITDGLHCLMSCILPTMHCRSGVVSSVFHHCQRGRNNSQHSRANRVGSCCFRLHVALQAKKWQENWPEVGNHVLY